MSPPTEQQENCRHFAVTRLRGDNPAVEFDGEGILVPLLKCSDCGTVFYILKASKTKAKKEEGAAPPSSGETA